MIIFSDLHLREESADIVFDEVLPGIKAAADQYGGPIVFLGDWWHVRYRLPVVLLNRVVELLDSWRPHQVHMLPGNHDQVDVHGTNGLEVLAQLSNVTVYTEPTRNGLGLWLPYRTDPQEVLDELQRFDGLDVVWLHQGVLGATKNGGMIDETGLSVDAFAHCRCGVYAGHYHRVHECGPVQFVGSPWQTRADEAGQEKGYWVQSDRGFVFSPKAWGPRYHVLEVAPGGAVPSLEGIEERDKVTVKAAAGVDVEALGEQLRQVHEQHVIVPEPPAPEQRLEVEPGRPTGDYLHAYVEARAGELAPDLLLTTLATIQKVAEVEL